MQEVNVQKDGNVKEAVEIHKMDESDAVADLQFLHSAMNIKPNVPEIVKSSVSEMPEPMETTLPPPKQNFHLKSIMIEHCYARPYNWRPETNFLRPTKTLFIPQATVVKKKPNYPLVQKEDEIDVDSVQAESPVIYDLGKAKKLMEECEKHAAYARDDINREDDWDEKISRTNWTPSQNHLFNIMVNILNSDRMSRMAYSGAHNEPVLRRTVIEKSVKRFRQLMAKYSWENKLAQWLHYLLLDNLTTPYLAAYLDILQTLKHKLPTFVDKLMYGPNNRVGATSNESLYPLLKRPWDPVASSLNQDKPKKLPGSPVIIIVPGAPSTSATMYSKRLHRWINLFSNLATVTSVYNNIGTNGNKLTMMNCVDQMFAATRAKIQEVKGEYPSRPIILAGFNAGSGLALQVAQVEVVNCILCLGFSIHTAEGNRGDPDDNLLELQCPVLFVIGQCANTALKENMEDIRERMRVETGLLIIGSADDYLRVNTKKKRSEGITQSVVDRCIVDEVGEFISGLLLSPYPPQIRQSPAHMPIDLMKRPKVERKRNNSNGSSLDSEPPSPTPRISRPGQTISPVFGRPPGSKSKSKIEAKWHAMQQGTPHLHHPIPSLPSSNVPSPTNSNPDDPLTDSNEPVGDSIKKVPVSVKSFTNTSTPKSSQSSAKLQALGIPSGRNMYHGSTLSNLLQGGGVRTLPPNPQAKQIKGNTKVLENVTISSSGSGKMMAMPGRPLDMSKMTVLNSSNAPKINISNSFGNVVLMSEGKLKTNSPAVRAPMIFPKGKTSIASTIPSSSASKSNLTKYITSKKQLLANRNKVVKKMPYISAPPNASTSNLPPPTNLTSQDIMDLPIIFADDNQMLTNNTIQPSDMLSSQILQSTQIKTNANSKLVFLNKQPAMLKHNILKRPPSNISKTNPIKYAKIILSKAPSNEDLKKMTAAATRLTMLAPNMSLKDETSPVRMDIDLENELVATAITKPNFVPSESKNIPLVYKTSDIGKTILSDRKIRQPSHMDPDEDSDDPEYVPSKNDL